jgi:uncharacterized protein
VSERPTPVPDADSRPFWEGAADGRLRVQRCAACGEHVFYPRAVCPHCSAADPEWTTASGRGIVYSYTVVHRPPPGFEDDAPYAVALVDLEEGVRLMARLEVERPAVGMAVEVAFRPGPNGFQLPYFVEAEPA